MTFKSDVVIGLEIHVELDIKTKLFSGCPSTADNPNAGTDEVSLGLPGSKPTINKKAFEYALKLALALNCKIADKLIFSRKSYFYPDMSKNYQITQYETPLGSEGNLRISEDKSVAITRIHLEEDPAALIHPSGMQLSSYVLVDYNRSGRALCEIVTAPQITSAEEARQFMKTLITILRHLKIFDNQRCIIKADANVSIRESNYSRVEIKNITGFKEMERALKYEISRQQAAIFDNKTVVQETRAWDSENGKTFSLRLKESEDDYGYITEPDLPIKPINEDLVISIRESLPELPAKKEIRYRELGLNADDAFIIASDYILSRYFDEISKTVSPVFTGKWLRRELMRVANYHNKEIEELFTTPINLSELFQLVERREITEKIGQRLIERLAEHSFSPREYAEKEGLLGTMDEADVLKLVGEVLSENDAVISDYHNGNEKAFNFLVGQVMRKAKGKADPGIVNKIIKEQLQKN